ncbi:MAG: hypothetical protein WCL11_16000 [Verrucomicrobiota bacterium]
MNYNPSSIRPAAPVHPARQWRRAFPLAAALALAWAQSALGQIPTVLTDKIYQGSGTINLLKDVSAANLQSYLQQNSSALFGVNGGAFFGVDLNENLSGNETRDSIGVAIKNVELVLRTTSGTMTFRDFYTSTTAMITESGAPAPQRFYTLFGTAGNSTLNGATTNFDPTKMEDVLQIRNVAFTGSILSAQLNVNFLTTASTKVQGNETFFDYSGGPEVFALMGRSAANTVDANGAGVSGAPSSVTYSASSQAATALPGAPSPPLGVLAMLGGLLAWRARRSA